MTGQRTPGMPGHLVIIGGHEDREDDKVILERFVALAGGTDARIFVITAASSDHDAMWKIYDRAFGELGVAHRETTRIDGRDDATDEDTAERVRTADGIFMTGGDQKRLMALIGGTRIDHAMHVALRDHGAAIGGTSAGASAMAEHMLVDGVKDLRPQKGAIQFGMGLGFVRRIVIDQHFSERRRLGRLLSGISQNPYLFGAGIDEDTALVVQPGVGIQIVGHGAVTLIDGRDMQTDFTTAHPHDMLELADIRMHLLPAGATYEVPADPSSDPPPDAPPASPPDSPPDNPSHAAGTTIPPSLADAIRAIVAGPGATPHSPPGKDA